jgi:hypothetical protein
MRQNIKPESRIPLGIKCDLKINKLIFSLIPFNPEVSKKPKEIKGIKILFLFKIK